MHFLTIKYILKDCFVVRKDGGAIQPPFATSLFFSRLPLNQNYVLVSLKSVMTS